MLQDHYLLSFSTCKYVKTCITVHVVDYTTNEREILFSKNLFLGILNQKMHLNPDHSYVSTDTNTVGQRS